MIIYDEFRNYTVHVVYVDFSSQVVGLEKAKSGLFQFCRIENVRGKDLGTETTVFKPNECFQVVWGRIDASLHTVPFSEFSRQRLTKEARYLTTLFGELDVPLPNMYMS
jgi:hypothetical protein